MLRLEPGGCKVLTTYQWRGRELHLRIHYSVQIQGGRLQLRADSGSLGRVNLGPYWIKHLQSPLLKLLPLLKRETVLLNRLENIRLEPAGAFLKIRASTGSLAP